MSICNIEDNHWMKHALGLAKQAAQSNEVPVGAVIVHEDTLIAEGWNQPIVQHDPTAHAEIIALRKAASLRKNYRLINSTLYVTLEPCAMCLGAMIQARIQRLVFGAWDQRAGAVKSVFQIADEPRLNHKIKWQGGIMEEECRVILQEFFKKRRIAV